MKLCLPNPDTEGAVILMFLPMKAEYAVVLAPSLILGSCQLSGEKRAKPSFPNSNTSLQLFTPLFSSLIRRFLPFAI